MVTCFKVTFLEGKRFQSSDKHLYTDICIMVPFRLSLSLSSLLQIVPFNFILTIFLISEFDLYKLRN